MPILRHALLAAAATLTLAAPAARVAGAQLPAPGLFTSARGVSDATLLCSDVGTIIASCTGDYFPQGFVPGNSNPVDVAHIHSVARAAASFGTLHAYAALSHDPIAGNGVFESAAATAVARFTDQVTIRAQPGATSAAGLFYTQLLFEGHADGHFAEALLTVGGSTGRDDLGRESFVRTPETFADPALAPFPNGAVNGKFEFGPIPFTVGTPFMLETRLLADARAFNGVFGLSAADFENTATLLGARLTDASGNPLPGLVIETASGAVLPNLTPSAVPEPGALPLLAAGVGALIVVGARRRRAPTAARPR